jgi:fructokinase
VYIAGTILEGPVRTHRPIDIAGTGFTVLDRVYADRRMDFEALGGSCGNVLVSLAMLQRSVVPVLALGHDEVGQWLVDEFQQAGADTSYITRRHELASPILAQELDTSSGQHWFSFVCPETQTDFPRYAPIERADVERAEPVLENCSVFYADRLTDTTLTAMERAFQSGAIVYFEPSSVSDEVCFEHALRSTTVLKYSHDQIGHHIDHLEVPSDLIAIATFGTKGLRVAQGKHQVWLNATPAPVVRDACGSGDMVSVGVIDWIVANTVSSTPNVEDLVGGIVAGQRLASFNCAYRGARGLFQRYGARAVRSFLDGQDDLFCEVD